MATISSSKQTLEGADKTVRVLWEAMGDDDDGTPIIVGERPDGSVQPVGTFGGATVTLQGSNDGVNWVSLTDEASTAVTFTATGLRMFLPRCWQVRVITAGGSGTDIDVYMVLGG